MEDKLEKAFRDIKNIPHDQINACIEEAAIRKEIDGVTMRKEGFIRLLKSLGTTASYDIENNKTVIHYNNKIEKLKEDLAELRQRKIDAVPVPAKPRPPRKSPQNVIRTPRKRIMTEEAYFKYYSQSKIKRLEKLIIAQGIPLQLLLDVIWFRISLSEEEALAKCSLHPNSAPRQNKDPLIPNFLNIKWSPIEYGIARKQFIDFCKIKKAGVAHELYSPFPIRNNNLDNLIKCFYYIDKFIASNNKLFQYLLKNGWNEFMISFYEYCYPFRSDRDKYPMELIAEKIGFDKAKSQFGFD